MLAKRSVSVRCIMQAGVPRVVCRSPTSSNHHERRHKVWARWRLEENTLVAAVLFPSTSWCSFIFIFARDAFARSKRTLKPSPPSSETPSVRHARETSCTREPRSPRYRSAQPRSISVLAVKVCYATYLAPHLTTSPFAPSHPFLGLLTFFRAAPTLSVVVCILRIVIMVLSKRYCVQYLDGTVECFRDGFWYTDVS